MTIYSPIKNISKSTDIVISRSRKILSLIFIGALSVLVVSYIVLVNDIATTGFTIKSLENDVSRVKESYEKLEVQAAELQDVSRTAKPEASGFVAVDKIEYLGSVVASGVAIR